MTHSRLTRFINTTHSFREKIINSNIGTLIDRIHRYIDAVIVLLVLIGVIGSGPFLTGWTIAILAVLFLQTVYLALRWAIQRYNQTKGGHHG